MTAAAHIGTAGTVPADTDRLGWLDRAKGLGIVLVVIGHAWIGLRAAGVLADDGMFRVVEQLIYNFHMPLFFLLSGFTYEGWARRRSLGQAALSRVTRLIWPLVLWTYIFALFRFAAGGAANTQAGLDSLLVLPLPPRDHFWFLLALFFLHLIALPIATLPRKPLPGVVWLVLAVLCATIVAQPGLPLGPLTVDAAVHSGIFLLGVWLARLPSLPSGQKALAFAAALFVTLQYASLSLPETVIGMIVTSAVLSLCFCILINGMDGDTTLNRLLVTLGTLSMPIYLAHTIFTAATRTVLFRFTDHAAPHLILGVAAGLIGPVRQIA